MVSKIPMTTLSTKIKELRAKGTQGEWKQAVNDFEGEVAYIYKNLETGISVLFKADWGTEDDATLITFLVNNAQKIANQLEAYQAFAEEMKGMDVEETSVELMEDVMLAPSEKEVNKRWRTKRDQLLTTLNKALKE